MTNAEFIDKWEKERTNIIDDLFTKTDMVTRFVFLSREATIEDMLTDFKKLLDGHHVP